jgi:hypothetical protein
MEQRAYRRYPASRKAYLVREGVVMRCRLIDVAQGGARIAAPSEALDGEVHLVDPTKRRVHLTRMIWQGDGQIGLQFLATKAFSTPLGGLAGATDIVRALGPWRHDPPAA